MKPMEIAELIKREDPKLFNAVQEQEIARIIRAAFVQVGKQIDAANEGVVKVAGLGNFRVRKAEQGVDGKAVTVRRVIFLRPDQDAVAGKRAKKQQ